MKKFKCYIFSICFFFLISAALSHADDIDDIILLYNESPEIYWRYSSDIGIFYWSSGEFFKALQYLNTAVDKYKEHNSLETLSWLYWYLGDSYYSLGMNTEAIDAFYKGLQYENDRNSHDSLKYSLFNVLIIEGDNHLSKNELAGAEELYTQACAFYEKEPGSIYSGELGIRLFIIDNYLEPTGSYIFINTTAIYCNFRDAEITETLKHKAENDAFIFSEFLRITSNNRVLPRISFFSTDCIIKQIDYSMNVTIPEIESANNAETLFDIINQTIMTTDLYVIITPLHPDLTASTSYGWRMPLSYTSQSPGKARINLTGSSALAWIHEFNHTIATLYYPALGIAHRFMSNPEYEPGTIPEPCTIDNIDTEGTAWPLFLNGAGEIDYYVGLYQNMEYLGGWDKMADISDFFAKYF